MSDGWEEMGQKLRKERWEIKPARDEMKEDYPNTAD